MSEWQNPKKDRHVSDTLIKWLENIYDKKDFDEYFLRYGYKKVAIVGVDAVSVLIYRELQKAGKIEVMFFVDVDFGSVSNLCDLPVKSIEQVDDWCDIDILVVPPMYDYDKINKWLACKNCNIQTINLRECLYGF